MAFEIIVDPPKGTLFRRFARAVAKLFGAILVVAGLAAASLPLLLLFVIVASLVLSGVSFPDMDPGQVFIFMVAGVIAVVCMGLGIRIVRGRRRMALFLRRFGYDDATRALSFAVTTAMGQRWRLVTLDDEEIAPIHGSEGKGRLASALRWIALILVIGGLFWLFGGGLAEYMGGITDDYMAAGRGGSFTEIMGRIFGAFFMLLIAGLLVGGFVLVIVAFFGATALFSWSSYRSYKKAELEKSISIDTAEGIEPAVRSILRRSRKILAPRLVVARVAHMIWRDVVTRLASACAVVLIDVSECGEGLLWEIKALKARHADKCILVGQYDALLRIADAPAGSDSGESLEQRLARLLDGSRVFAYTGDQPRQMQQFASLLRASMNSVEVEG